MQRMKIKPKAYRVESKDARTNKITVTYIGTLEESKQFRLEDARDRCKVAILALYPDYKQMNAALGLYSNSVILEIKTGIQAHRTYCDNIEVLINSATSLEEVWNIVIDFNNI
jgi:hypothetical protein